MHVLYYQKPSSSGGGVSNVAYYLPKALSKRVKVTYYPRFLPEKRCLTNFFKVYRDFAMNEYDVIHFNSVPKWINGSSVMLKFSKERCVHTILNIHGIIQQEHEVEPTLGPISYADLSNTVGACKAVDRVVVNSEYMRNSVVSYYGAKRSKIVVIPNGVDLKRFSGEADRLALSGEPAILYVGDISRRKGVDVLIKAAAKLQSALPNMKLHLVGSGRYLSDFQRLALEEGIGKRVFFHGWVPDSIIPRYFKSADMCVFPSRYEPFGIVVLEAMASGVPIVASNAGGIREIICHGENGFLFEIDDSAALSNTILALYKDADLRKRMSDATLKSAVKYSWENIAERYASLYKRLCD